MTDKPRRVEMPKVLRGERELDFCRPSDVLAVVTRANSELDAAAERERAKDVRIAELEAVIRGLKARIDELLALPDNRAALALIRTLDSGKLPTGNSLVETAVRRRVEKAEAVNLQCCKGCPDCLGIGYSPAVLKDALARAEKAEATIARVEEWTLLYGKELVPRGADTYGEGKRDAKDEVKRILAQGRTS